MTLPPFIQKLQKLVRRKPVHTPPNPARDWHILIASFLILLVISIIWNVWFFSDALSGKEGMLPVADEAATDTSVIEQADKLFIIRAEEEARYRNEYRFVDPSR